MADEIVNPGDRESFRRLLQSLEALDRNLTEQVRQQGEQTRQQVSRERRSAAREARTRPQARAEEAAEPTRRPESVQRVQRAEENIQRARRESSRLLVVESRASRDRLSAAERILQAERDIARARAVRVQAAARQSVAPIGSPEFARSLQQAMQRTGAFQPTLPPRRSTIDAEELRRRRELLAPPPPPPPRQPPTTVGGSPEPDPRRRGVSLSDYIGGTTRPGAAVSELSDREAEAYDRAVRRASGSTAELDRELQFLTRNAALSGDQMRRHGLLTTEFISAAAQGRTTIRELGVQIGGTVAKFGGWTLAATATYGALAAVQQLGAGAVESLNGVTSLQRVVQNLNTEQAQQQFRALSREFNLPISQVTAASFEAGKAFRTQADMAEATKAALVGVKVGEIDAGEAARFVTAIYRGFHLEVSELNDVMDVANQLQNRFGADFRGTAEGVAKSAGAFGAAGGSFRELAALVATGQLATGRTGAEIGTALRRTSEIVKRPERRQTIIDVLGIDPRDSSITQIIERAQAKVKQGADVGEVARAITTPELASGRIIPILQAQALYQQTLREAQQDRAGGSAARELNTVLGGIGEKATKVLNSMQRIGSSLGESGALSSAVLLLDTLNLTLKTTEGILGLFNQLPAPLRQGTLLAGQFLGTMALLRRFNTGQVFAEGGVLNRSLARDPARLRRAEITQGLQDELRFVNTERERAAQSASRLSFQQGQARSRVDTLLAADDGSDDHRRNIARAQERVEDIERRKLDAIDDEADLADRQRRLVESQNNFRRDTTRRAGVRGGTVGRARVDEVARQQGILAASSIDPRPSGTAPIALVPGLADEAAAGRQARLRQQVADEFRRAQREATAVGRSRILTTGVASLAAGGAAVTGAARGVRNVGSALAAAIGPLEAGVLAFLFVYETYNSIAGQMRETAAAVDAIQGAPLIENLDEAARKIHEQAEGPGGLRGVLEKAQNVFADIYNIKPGTGGDISSPAQARGQARQAAERDLANIRAANEHGVALTRAQIEARFRTNLQRGQDPDEALKQAMFEADRARGIIYAPDAKALERAKEDVRTFKERLQNYRKTISDVDRVYGEGLNPEQLVKANAVRIFTRGLDRTAIRATARQISDLRNQLATSNDPEQQAQLIQQIQDAQASVEDELRRKFEQRISFARNPTESRGLRRNYVANLRRLRVEPIRRQIRELDRHDRDTKRELDELGRDQQTEQQLDRPGQAAVGRAQEVNKDRERLRSTIKGNGDRRKRLRRQLRRENEELSFLEREQARAQFQAEQQLYDARTERLQSETADPLRQARILRERLHHRTERIREAIKRGIATQDQLEQAIAAENRALQQIAQARVARFQANQGLAAAQYANANIGNEGARLQFAVSQAQQLQNFIQGQGDKLGPEELINAQRGVVEARTAYAEYVFQQAQDLINARAELALSRTEDPIAQANIRLRTAQQLVAYARTPAERLRAQAEVNNRRREATQTKQREAYDQIEFDSEMGRIERDVEIQRLQTLLKTIHGNRDLRREIQRRIHSLQNADSGEFELDIGSIRLPTPYEVHRALREGRRAAQGGVSVTNSPTVNVFLAKGDDGSRVIKTLDDHLNTSARSILRAGALVG